MKQLITKVFNKVPRLLQLVKNTPKTPAEKLQAQRFKQWFRDKGDKTHRLNYPLQPTSVIMDLGGYKGEWSHEIVAKYQCYVHIFEPHIPFYNNIVERFAHNPKIKAYPFGLGGKTEEVGFSIADNGSSVFEKSDKKVKVQLRHVGDFLHEHRLGNVDLIKINIEGGEYDLLETLLQNNLASVFKNIQVQFHDFFPEARQRMEAIQRELRKTHELTYQYEFVWENWKRKS